MPGRLHENTQPRDVAIHQFQNSTQRQRNDVGSGDIEGPLAT